MPLNQSKKKESVAARLFTAIGSMFSKITPNFGVTQAKNSKYRKIGKKQPAGNKIKRAIRRGNHGIVHKSGTYARAIAEEKRENWLRDHNKPIIPLSNH